MAGAWDPLPCSGVTSRGAPAGTEPEPAVPGGWWLQPVPHIPGCPRSPALPVPQPGEDAAPRCPLGSVPSPLRLCLSFRRLPAGGKAVTTAPVPGQPPQDESDRKTEPHSSVSDLVNSLTSEMLMVGDGTGSPGVTSHPGHLLASPPALPCATSAPARPSLLCRVPVTAGHRGGTAGVTQPSPRKQVVPET